jgi:hypothetical protein
MSFCKRGFRIRCCCSKLRRWTCISHTVIMEVVILCLEICIIAHPATDTSVVMLVLSHSCWKSSSKLPSPRCIREVCQVAFGSPMEWTSSFLYCRGIRKDKVDCGTRSGSAPGELKQVTSIHGRQGSQRTFARS